MSKNRILSWLILLLWPVIDKFLRLIYRIRPLRTDGSGIISTELRRHRGHPIMLDDGSEIKVGDAIIELPKLC